MLARLAEAFQESFVPGCWLVHGPPSRTKSRLLGSILSMYPHTVVDVDASSTADQFKSSLESLADSTGCLDDTNLIVAVPFIDEWKLGY
jgi:hypothetical protein